MPNLVRVTTVRTLQQIAPRLSVRRRQRCDILPRLQIHFRSQHVCHRPHMLQFILVLYKHDCERCTRCLGRHRTLKCLSPTQHDQDPIYAPQQKVVVMFTSERMLGLRSRLRAAGLTPATSPQRGAQLQRRYICHEGIHRDMSDKRMAQHRSHGELLMQVCKYLWIW
jgi:hypothetical protein